MEVWMDRTCPHGLKIGQCYCTAHYCSGCGGEKDAEGWCANYCEQDDPIPDSPAQLLSPPAVNEWDEEDAYLFI
ncbi:hypothetical protein KKD42_01060 [Patescibacteria group bacterium]|nr:hypothetical protein [Patescibacteria group bacterium]